MRIVLDTNVLVSGLLNPGGATGRLLDLILGGHLGKSECAGHGKCQAFSGSEAAQYRG